MRIGEKEADGVFNRLICPAIEAAGLAPIRIDRVRHNDRIDQRIEKEIRSSDLMVADLTFARPSVYWEAGYAERSIPVVYTCREDHLRPQHDDTEGNRRIHFDLATKNLIVWKSASDKRFMARLEKQVRLVARPLFARREESERAEAAAKKFAALSVKKRRQTLLDAFLGLAVHHSLKGGWYDWRQDMVTPTLPDFEGACV